MKELAKEFDGQLECLGENTEKHKTFSVPIRKEFDNGKTIKYKTEFLDSFRFMASSLVILINNLSEGLHKDKCIGCKSCLDYIKFKDDQLILRCFECKRNYKKNFNKDLFKRFATIYEFYNKDINKFILLLRK